MRRRKTVKTPTVCGTPLGRAKNKATGPLRALVVAMSAHFALGATALAATLDNVSYTTLPGNQQQISIKLSDPIEEPQTFAINAPARIAIDLLGTTNALDGRVVPVGVGNVDSVNIVEANDRTRVVLNLDEMTEYETRIEGDRILITLETDAEGLLDDGEDEDLLVTPAEGAVEVAQTDEPTPVVEAEEDSGIVVELPTSLPLQEVAQEPEVSVKEVAEQTPAPAPAPVAEAPKPESRQASIPVQQAAPVEEFVETSQPSFDSASFTPQEPTYVGEELSLNFQDIEVRSVLQLLADFTDLNIVVSDSVSGKVTLRLKNVPWDQALDIILRTKGLDKRKSGNVIMVAPSQEIAAREASEREANQKAIELEPLRTEFVQVNYAKAAEVAAILKSDTGGVLSDRGNVTIDDRTNTILVNDTVDVLGKVRALVTRLDIPVRQVLIESRIVIATDDFNRELGSRFGINRNTTNNDNEGLALSGNATGTSALLAGSDPGLNRFNVNLPATNQAGSIALALAKLPFGTLLELELSAMQAEGRGEVISSPRVITANQHEAYIEQGVEIPYLEASSSGASSIAFRKAVLALRVKPQITPDERIIMDLTVNKDTVGQIFSGEGQSRVPSIDTREVKTQVLVANGETVVLGGIYEQETIQSREQVPFFGDLPLIGKLFQHNSSEDDKTELLVFVTPKIVNDGGSALDN
jgi:type IV pilus assembly protein PilQ